MSVVKLFKIIEGQKLSVVANTASTIEVFISIVGADKAVVDLVSELKKDPESVSEVLYRIEFLTDAKFDFRYENPFDVALSAYALAISQFKPSVGRLAAERITTARNTWWCTQIARRLLEEAQSEPGNVVASKWTSFADANFYAVIESDASIQKLLFGMNSSKRHARLGDAKVYSRAAMGFGQWVGARPTAPVLTQNSHSQWAMHG